MGTWEVDGYPRGGRQTETRGATKEGGDRRDPEQEEHNKTQSTAITVAHGGADGGRSHGGGGRPMVVEQVEEEPEMESQRARGMPRTRGGGGRVEPRALVTKAKIQRSMA